MMDHVPRVLLDTTVFCGALLKPSGGNMRLLLLGASPLYRPVISQAVVAEFIHKACVDGIGKGPRIYTAEEVGLFLDLLSGIVEPDTSVQIRQSYRYVSTLPLDTPLWVPVSKLVDSWPENDALVNVLGGPIKETDLGDLHLVLAAVQTHPDIVVTSNQKHVKFLEPFCRVMTPSEFLAYIDAN